MQDQTVQQIGCGEFFAQVSNCFTQGWWNVIMDACFPWVPGLSFQFQQKILRRFPEEDWRIIHSNTAWLPNIQKT